MRKTTGILLAILTLLVGVFIGAFVQDMVGVKVIEHRLIDSRVRLV